MHLLLQPIEPIFAVDGGDSYPPLVGREEDAGLWEPVRAYYERSLFSSLALPLLWHGAPRPEAFDYLCRVLLLREGFRGGYGVGLVQVREGTWGLVQEHRIVLTYSAFPNGDENRLPELAGVEVRERALAFIAAVRIQGSAVHEVYLDDVLSGAP